MCKSSLALVRKSSRRQEGWTAGSLGGLGPDRTRALHVAQRKGPTRLHPDEGRWVSLPRGRRGGSCPPASTFS